MNGTTHPNALVLMQMMMALLVGAAPASSQIFGAGGGRVTSTVPTPPVVNSFPTLTRPGPGPCKGLTMPCPPFPWPGELFRLLDIFGRPIAYESATESPGVSVRQDESGNITEVTNSTPTEVQLTNGLTLGPNSSIEWTTRRIRSGYVVRDGVKYGADGSLENLTEWEVRLEAGIESAGAPAILLGPRARISGSGELVAGYVVVGNQRYDAFPQESRD